MPENYFVPFTSTRLTDRHEIDGKFNGNQHNGLFAVVFDDGSVGVEKNLADWTGNKTGRHYPAELLAQQEYLSARVGQAINAPIRDCLLVGDTTVLMPFIEGETGKDLGIENDPPSSPKSARLALFDYLVANADRRPKNIIYSSDGDYVGIDHALCNFRPRKPKPELIALLWNNGYNAENIEELRPLLIGVYPEFDRLDHHDRWIQMIENLDLLVEAFEQVAKAVVVKSDAIARAKQAEQKALELRRNEKFESASYAHQEASRLYLEASRKHPEQADYLKGQAEAQKNLAHTALSAYTLGENHSPVEFNKSGFAKIAERLRRRSKQAEEKGDTDTAQRLYYEAMDAQFRADQEISKGGAGSGRYPKGSGKNDLGSPKPMVEWEQLKPLLDKVGNAIEGEGFDRDSMEPEDWEGKAPSLKCDVAEAIANRLDPKWTVDLADFLESGLGNALTDPNPNDLIFDFSSSMRWDKHLWDSQGDEYPRFVGYASEMGAAQTNSILKNGYAVRASDPRFSEGVRAIAVSKLIGEWATTSNDHNIVSLNLQRAAQEEFGLENTADWDKAEVSSKQEDDYKANAPLYKAFVRAQYEETQDFFAKNGITEVPVYRGMYFPDDTNIPKWLDDFGNGKDSPIPTRPMSAFSYDSSSAVEFAQGATADLFDVISDYPNDVSVLVSGVVPASRVLSCAQTGFGCYKEREIVVLGGTDKWNIETGLETW